MFTKFGSFEITDILDIKGSSSRLKTASLDKVGDYSDYRTDQGYLYARIRAISSRVNKNHDGWPSVELAGGQEEWDRISSQRTSSEGGFVVEANKKAKYGFSTFLGKPIFVDHNNSDPSRARGVVVDAKLHIEDHKTAGELDPYYASAPDNHMPPTWVELLLEIDADRFPKFAKAIIDGSKDSAKGIDGFSMGANVEISKCSHCGNEASAPEEFCNHVKMKGAFFDYTDAKSGRKISKKSYEDCLKVGFFELSGVFNPADETALLREVKASVNKEGINISLDAQDPSGQIACPFCNGTGIADGTEIVDEQSTLCPHCGGVGTIKSIGYPSGDGAITPNRIGPEDVTIPPTVFPPERRRQGSFLTKKAEADIPQADKITAPQEVDTLREEKVCPVCGSNFHDIKCDVCGYEEPPEGLNNPDLQQAQETGVRSPQVQEELQQSRSEGDDQSFLESKKNPITANVMNDMQWSPKVNPKLAGRVNVTERPIKVANPPVSNEPKDEVVISDQEKPVTSAFRTAQDLINRAKQRNQKENNMSDDTKVAADPADQSGKAKKQVDVTGVGGIDEATAEQASKADGQVDATGKGGTGVEDVSPDKTENLPTDSSDNAGYDESKTTDDSGPTKTFPDNGTKPVTSQPFPTEAAKKGTEPADSVGKAEDRVDVEQSTTSESNNSGPTKTWSGTDGNGVTKQQDAVTNVPTQSGGVKSHLLAAFKLADVEIDLGITSKDDKYQRIAELEKQSEQELTTQISTLSKVKTAGLVKHATAPNGVGRLPSFKRSSFEPPKEEAQKIDNGVLDSAIFSA